MNGQLTIHTLIYPYIQYKCRYDSQETNNLLKNHNCTHKNSKKCGTETKRDVGQRNELVENTLKKQNEKRRSSKRETMG